MARLGLLAVLAGCIVLAPAYGQDKSVLKWKFEKDKPFFQKMTTDTQQSMRVSDNEVKQNQSQTFYFSWTPIKQEGDVWELRQRIEGIVMSIDIGGNKIAYDSTKESEAANPLSEFFKALKGSEFIVSLNVKDNKITKITGREEFIKKMVTANPQMQALLDKILNEQALKDMAEPTFGAIPGYEATKGDKKTGEWTRKSTFDLGPIGKYENTYKYTYEGKEKALDKIKVDLDMVYKAGETNAGGLPFKITSSDLKTVANKDGKTTAGGQILFDSAKGRIEKSQSTLTVKGDLTIEIGGQSTKVNLEQSQNTTVDTMDTNPLAPAGAPSGNTPVPAGTIPPLPGTPPMNTPAPPKTETKKEEPKKEEPKKEAPKKDEPKKEEPKKDEKK